MWMLPLILLLAGIVVYYLIGRRKSTDPDTRSARIVRYQNRGNEVWITLPKEDAPEEGACVIEVFEDDAG